MDISRISGPDVMPAGFSTDRTPEPDERQTVEREKKEPESVDDRLGRNIDKYA